MGRCRRHDARAQRRGLAAIRVAGRSRPLAGERQAGAGAGLDRPGRRAGRRERPFPVASVRSDCPSGSSGGGSTDRCRTGRRRRRPVHATASCWRSRPTGSAALARIERAETALRHRYGRMLLRWHSPGARQVARADLAPAPNAGNSIQELTLIADLDAAPVPTHVRLGLFHAATALPGATVTRRAGGGVAVSASHPQWQSVSYSFDRRNGELLTGLPVDGGYPDVAGPPAPWSPRARSTRSPRSPKTCNRSPASARRRSGRRRPRRRSRPSLPRSAAGRTVFTVLFAARFRASDHARTDRMAGNHRLGRPRDLPPRKPAFDRRGRFLPGNQGDDPCLPPTSVRVWPAMTIYRAGKLVYRLPGQSATVQPQRLVRWPLSARAFRRFPTRSLPTTPRRPYTGP